MVVNFWNIWNISERRIKKIDKKLKKEENKVLEAETKNKFYGGLI